LDFRTVAAASRALTRFGLASAAGFRSAFGFAAFVPLDLNPVFFVLFLDIAFSWVTGRAMRPVRSGTGVDARAFGSPVQPNIALANPAASRSTITPANSVAGSMSAPRSQL